MKKLILFFAAIMMASTGLWAEGSIIEFSSTYKMYPGLKSDWVNDVSKRQEIADDYPEFYDFINDQTKFRNALDEKGIDFFDPKQFLDNNGQTLTNDDYSYQYTMSSHIGQIYFSSDLETINSAFHYCYSLISISIPNSVKTIGNQAFYQSGLTFISLPENLTTIGSLAFAETPLTSITIPSSVITIDMLAFSRCFKLTDVYVTWTSNLPTLGKDVFLETPVDNATLHVPAGTLALYQNADVWNTFHNIVEYGSLADAKTAAIAEINAAVEGVVDEGILFKANTAIGDIQSAVTVEQVDNIKAKALSDIENVFLANAKADAISAINSVANEAKDKIDKASSYPAAAATKEKFNEEIEFAVGNAVSEINNASTVADVDAVRSKYTLVINGILTTAQKDIAAINDFEKYKEFYITQIETARKQAINEIVATGIDARIEELNEIVDYAVNIINNATTAEQIDDAGSKILIILSLFHAGKEIGVEEGKVSGLEEGKAETFGTLGTKQNGPAIIVTDQDGKEIILYSPKSVEYIKVNE